MSYRITDMVQQMRRELERTTHDVIERREQLGRRMVAHFYTDDSVSTLKTATEQWDVIISPQEYVEVGKKLKKMRKALRRASDQVDEMLEGLGDTYV